MIKRILQIIFGAFLDKPIIPPGKTSGYSLTKSQLADYRSGDHSKVNFPCNIVNASLGDYSYIATNSRITNTEIGKFCSIGPNFCCGLGIHPTHGISTSPMFYSVAHQNGVTLVSENKIQESKRIIIGNDVFIGANVTLLDGVQIGDGAVIGAGAVVTKNIPPYAVAVGVPAKIVKYRFPDEIIQDLLRIKWWDFDSKKINEVEKYFFEVNEFIEVSKV
jgi:virginiamycin A acetyltransferase